VLCSVEYVSRPAVLTGSDTVKMPEMSQCSRFYAAILFLNWFSTNQLV